MSLTPLEQKAVAVRSALVAWAATSEQTLYVIERENGRATRASWDALKAFMQQAVDLAEVAKALANEILDEPNDERNP